MISFISGFFQGIGDFFAAIAAISFNEEELRLAGWFFSEVVVFMLILGGCFGIGLWCVYLDEKKKKKKAAKRKK